MMTRNPTTIEMTTEDDELIASCQAVWRNSQNNEIKMGGRKFIVMSVDFSMIGLSHYTTSVMSCHIRLVEVLDVQEQQIRGRRGVSGSVGDRKVIR